MLTDVLNLERTDSEKGRRVRPWSVGGVVTFCAVVMLLAEVPLLWKFFLDLWSRPQYEFFPLLLAAVPFVAVVCLRDTSADDIRPGGLAIGLALWLVALACLAVGGVMYLKWFAPVSTLLLLAGGVWLVGGRGLAKALWPVGALLLLILPPPGETDQSLLIALRQMAVTAAGRLLDLIGLPQYVHGAVIDIPGDRLMVEEACSGINSMLAVLAFTVLLAFWKRLPLRALLVLLPAAFAYVFWANVMRITVCAVAKGWWKIDLLTGAPHELLGLLLFVVCMTLVFSTERLVQAVFGWEDADDAEPAPRLKRPSTGRPTPRAYGRVLATMTIAFAATGTFAAVRTWKAWPESTLPTAEAWRMPETLAGWTRIDEKDTAAERAEVSGRQSRLWQYRLGPLVATVGVDYPFSGYHDATICYGLAGWKLSAMQENPPRGDGPAPFAVSMVRPPLSHGTLTFALCDESGVWWRRPPPIGTESTFTHAMRLSRRKALSPRLAQLQVLNVDFDPPAAADRQRLDELFAAAATAVDTQIKGFHAAAH